MTESVSFLLTASESRRATLRAELAALEQAQPMGVVQLTPAALQHHLERHPGRRVTQSRERRIDVERRNLP